MGQLWIFAGFPPLWRFAAHPLSVFEATTLNLDEVSSNSFSQPGRVPGAIGMQAEQARSDAP